MRHADQLSDAELALRPHRVTGPVMAAFLDAAAIQPAAATRYRPGTPAAEQEVQRLTDAGILRAAPGGHWFDLRHHYAIENRRAARRAVWGVGVALLVASIAVLFYIGD